MIKFAGIVMGGENREDSDNIQLSKLGFKVGHNRKQE